MFLSCNYSNYGKPVLKEGLLLASITLAYTETSHNQKQPFRSVLRKRCFKNMQQIYRGTLMPKCDFFQNTFLYEHLFWAASAQSSYLKYQEITKDSNQQ